jgi:hypothetical protein
MEDHFSPVNDCYRSAVILKLQTLLKLWSLKNNFPGPSEKNSFPWLSINYRGPGYCTSNATCKLQDHAACTLGYIWDPDMSPG